jgi:hypothetical protein
VGHQARVLAHWAQPELGKYTLPIEEMEGGEQTVMTCDENLLHMVNLEGATIQ